MGLAEIWVPAFHTITSNPYFRVVSSCRIFQRRAQLGMASHQNRKSRICTAVGLADFGQNKPSLPSPRPGWATLPGVPPGMRSHATQPQALLRGRAQPHRVEGKSGLAPVGWKPEGLSLRSWSLCCPLPVSHSAAAASKTQRL